MSRDKSPTRLDELDESGSDDWEFDMHACGECRQESIGKSMWPCSECHTLICQGCNLIPRGCADDDDEKVCNQCFEDVFHSKHKYCTESWCDGCSNKSPQFKAAQQRELDQYDKLKATINVVAWKKIHPAINYPGKYKGRYLIDLFLSRDDFERGYIDWLIKEGSGPPKSQYSEEQNRNFQKYVLEATELKNMVAETKLGEHNLRNKDE